MLLSNGFEIYEAGVFFDVFGWNLEQGDHSTKLYTCGYKQETKSAFNHRFLVDYLIDDINVDDFDALAIPGGFESYGFYEDAFDEKFLNVIREFKAQNKMIATVCVGALPLAKSGVIDNKECTTYSSRQSQLNAMNVNVVNEPIVSGDKFITSWNPQTAIYVAFMLLEHLTTKENANHIKEIMGFNNLRSI